jgi:hypothetical protein
MKIYLVNFSLIYFQNNPLKLFLSSFLTLKGFLRFFLYFSPFSPEKQYSLNFDVELLAAEFCYLPLFSEKVSNPNDKNKAVFAILEIPGTIKLCTVCP